MLGGLKHMIVPFSENTKPTDEARSKRSPSFFRLLIPLIFRVE